MYVCDVCSTDIDLVIEVAENHAQDILHVFCFVFCERLLLTTLASAVEVSPVSVRKISHELMGKSEINLQKIISGSASVTDELFEPIQDSYLANQNQN